MKKVCYWYPICPMKRFYEMGQLEEEWILQYCKDDYSKCVRKKLEEEGKYHPDNMLPNGEIREDLR